ncbi:MAG: flavin reductase family protein [Synergistaceae bacterium]|jgi:flavin reductase (DIM6/NTAB) family NADH-FMN oxidoreductase RutF|nr:flavin reductase family protein [Synergistaceae bacterium]
MFEGKKNMGATTFLFPTPIVLCGTYGKNGRANLATLAWTGICNSEPPAVQISVRPSRYTHETILDKREFTVCVPSSSQSKIADFCGLVSGRDVDKPASAGLATTKGQFTNAPLVAEFPVCMECRLIASLELGSHDLFVGEVVAAWVDAKYLDEHGNADLRKLSPIAYAPVTGGAEYFAIGESAGKSFSIGAAIKKIDGRTM